VALMAGATENGREWPDGGGRVRVWAGAIAALLVWQALFWPLVHVVERAARPAIDTREAISFRLLDAEGQGNALHAAQRTGLEGYLARGSEDAEALVFIVPFEVSDPAEPMALFLSLREQIREIRVNGVIVQAVAPIPRLAGLITSEPSYYPLPPTALRAGANQLEVEKDVFGFDTALSEFAIGPADELAAAYRWRTFLLTDLAMIGVALLLFTVLLCLVINWPAADRPRIHALIALLSTCALATYFLSFNPPVELPLNITVLFWTWVNVAIALTMAHYARRDADVQWRWLDHAWLAWPVLLSAAALAVVAAGFDGARTGEWLLGTVNASYWVVIASAVFSVVLLARASVAGGIGRWFDRSILAICFSAFAMDRVGSIYDLVSPFDAALPLTLPWSPIAGSLLGLSMVLALAREAAEARHVVVSANSMLEQRLAAQEQALAESYDARNRIMQRASVLEERQRIVRDMHDGLGGQLLGLKLQIGAKQLDTPAIQASLDASITDMRLIVDSLDMADEPLLESLRAFEGRVRSVVEATGCTLLSDHELGAETPSLGPHSTLQVLRILQEAVTNTLRHAGARTIWITSKHADGQIEISIRDDGRGFDNAQGGRGLANMDFRARAIGGDLSIEGGAGSGAHVRLRLPVR
jgi:two-component system, NarL family, sensor histidine kinase UhpB